MTTTTLSPLPTDPRPVFAAAVATAVEVTAGVRPDQLDGSTPCSEYDVRTLLGHLVTVFRRVAAVGRGESPFSVPQVTTGPPDDGWAAAARAAADDLQAVWTDATLLTRELVLPYGTHTGAVALATYTGELSTHSWDVATATGQRPAWNEPALRVAVTATRRMLPAEGRGERIPFGPVVAVPDGAALIDQLVGWQGRDPRWTPAP